MIKQAGANQVSSDSKQGKDDEKAIAAREMWPRSMGAIAQFLFLGLILGIGYTQDPIYNSPENQNTKYFHAFARAGHGFLSEDWLATTRDPLPAFTALVEWTYRFLHHEYVFYFYYILIFALYIYSLMGIVAIIYPLKMPPLPLGNSPGQDQQSASTASLQRASWLFLAFFFFIHIVHIEIFEVDIGWDLHAGVAMQYILGPVFQPANFGVFILLSILLFLRQRPFWAVGMLAIAVTFHPAYFPSVAALTGAYMVAQWWSHSRHAAHPWYQPLILGLVATVLMLPVFLYMTLGFPDTTPELAQRAKEIIVNERIPHHSIPAVWLDGGEAYVQMAIVAIAIWLARKSTLAWILAVPLVLATGLTWVQMLSGSETLAFVAPWRMSVFLVPIGTSVLLGWGAIALARVIPATRIATRLTIGFSIIVMTAVVIGGGYEQVAKFQTQDETIPVMEVVQQTAQPGDLYLIPPNVRAWRKFRLRTGAAIFINRKSHPYIDTEVIEWSDRLTLAQQFYHTQPRGQQCRLLKRTLVKDYGVTHVIFPVDQGQQACSGFEEVYQDEHYRLHQRQPRRSRGN
ncbi:MAG: hypothetical protein F6K30_05655 [Cyanothece sp. SIO2G6]|nr:hypothetical protein [Cyanothece sp. SIO2G6]